MVRLTSSLILILLLFTSPAFAQKKYPGSTKPTPPAATPKPKPPPVKVVKPANGGLFVVTNPQVARIVIRNSQGRVIEDTQSRDGKYEKEFPPGNYTVEVSADKYSPQRSAVEVRRARTESVTALLTPTTGAILISLGSVGDSATILIDNQRPANLTKKTGNRIQIDDLGVGPHTLRITHPSIAAYEEKVEVEGGIIKPVSPTFRVATVNLIIKSLPGARILVDGRMEGRVEDNGTLRIADKSIGQHTVRAELDKHDTVTMTKDFGVGDEVVNMPLKRTAFSGDFTESFLDAGTWSVPKTWAITPGNMRVRGSATETEIGLLKEKVWENFRMEFDVSLINNKGAAWVVRARDNQNYYLFQLASMKGSPQTTFQSFICENGQLRQLESPQRVAVDLNNPKDQFHIIVELKGSKIEHFIEVTSRPGERKRFGIILDSAFSNGRIGFGTRGDEEFIVYQVSVTPLK